MTSVPAGGEITEDQLAADQAAVRWAAVSRLEYLYSLVVEQIEGARVDGRPVDPRWAEFGLRVQRDLGTIYRLSKAPAVPEDEDPISGGVDPALAVLESLAELEAKRAGT
jgi:hypothetical protein